YVQLTRPHYVDYSENVRVHLVDVDRSNRALAPELVFDRSAELVAVRLLQVRVDRRAAAARRRDERAQLLRSVVDAVAVRIEELIRPVVRAAGIQRREIVAVDRVVAPVEPLDCRPVVAEQVIGETETRGDVAPSQDGLFRPGLLRE